MSVGSIGEDAACKFLTRAGYVIIERNHWQPWGEIDVVARAPDGTLVFVEVKTMTESSASDIMPEDNVTPAKLRKMRKAALSYAAARQDLVREGRGWRIDVLAVVLGGQEAIRHYENI